MKRRKRLSKPEMVSFIMLLAIFCIALSFPFIKDKIFTETHRTKELSSAEIKEIEIFSDEIRQDSIRRDKDLKQRFKKEKTITPFPFNPNTADSATLSKLGLHDWQINNLMKFREKGGKFRKADDFAKLYGLSSSDFSLLRPYINIPKDSLQLAWEKEKAIRDSIYKTLPQKFDTLTVLHLNEVDTTTLKKIPGIGSYYANKICRYRERLGGFVTTKQLKEIEGLPANIERWFTLPQHQQVRKTYINQTDFKGLVRHPYLNYEQVKAICNYIRKYGKISSLEELSNSEQFSAEEIQRLSPYISFE